MLQKQLTELAHVEQPTMAALLGRMERDGLIIRQIDPRDKRSTRLSLSTKGIERLPEAKEGLQEIADDAIKGLSGEEMAILIALLRRVIANLEEKKSDSRIS